MTTATVPDGRCTGPQCRAFMGEVTPRGLDIKTQMKHKVLLLPDVLMECHRCGHVQKVSEIMKRAVDSVRYT